MSRASQRAPRIRAPWHLWVIGLVFLGLYVIGARDFVLTRSLDSGYFAALGYGPDQIAYFTDYPAIPAILWGTNITTGLLAAILLLLRSRWATVAALVAAISQLILLVITFGLMGRWEILGPRLSIVDIGVCMMTIGLWLYCAALSRRHILL